MSQMYCSQCKMNVTPVKPDFNAILFIILLFTGIGWLTYLIIWALTPKKKCPTCGSDVSISGMPNQSQNVTISSNTNVYSNISENQSQPEEHFCPFCGSKIEKSNQICPTCNSNLSDR